jgi:hypothetical protein
MGLLFKAGGFGKAHDKFSPAYRVGQSHIFRKKPPLRLRWWTPKVAMLVNPSMNTWLPWGRRREEEAFIDAV